MTTPPTMTTLTLFTPSGVLARAAPLKLAAKRLGALGFDVQIDEAALRKHQRFAGDDDTRLAALHRVAAAAPAVAMATRGGYGLTRLLDRIDWPLLARSVAKGTRWVGHSDLTALHFGLLAHAHHAAAGGPHGPHGHHHPAGHRHDGADHTAEYRADDSVDDGAGHRAGHAAGAVAWAGPHGCDDFGRVDAADGPPAVDEVTRDCFVEAMSGQLEAIGFRTDRGFDGLQLSGTLWGGNLCMVNSLLGTAHWPTEAVTRGGVLFLEDVNEHPYRVERSLLQLHQAGVLDAQCAVLLGAFSGWKKSPLDRGYGLKTVVEHLRGVCKTPILTGLPFGHVPTKVCLPVGAAVQLLVDGRNALVGW